MGEVGRLFFVEYSSEGDSTKNSIRSVGSARMLRAYAPVRVGSAHMLRAYAPVRMGPFLEI